MIIGKLRGVTKARVGAERGKNGCLISKIEHGEIRLTTRQTLLMETIISMELRTFGAKPKDIYAISMVSQKSIFTSISKSLNGGLTTAPLKTSSKY